LVSVLTVRPAIFLVMGANIGTSVTNTIVSVGNVNNRGEFRRAFAGATVHDFFNFLTVLCIMPIEWISGE
jgi:sodium-dependent phosphate cotransporter